MQDKEIKTFYVVSSNGSGEYIKAQCAKVKDDCVALTSTDESGDEVLVAVLFRPISVIAK